MGRIDPHRKISELVTSHERLARQAVRATGRLLARTRDAMKSRIVVADSFIIDPGFKAVAKDTF